MGILTSAFNPMRRAELNESTARGLIEAMRNGNGGSVAGVPVTADSAMSVATVFACVRALAESSAMLPLILYQRVGRNKQRATDHPLYTLLHDAPNDEMTSAQLIEAIMANVVLWGNGCARLVIDNTGQVREMWPLLSRYLTIERSNGQLIYKYSAPDLRQTFQRHEVFHVPGLTLNGLTGLSVLGYMRRAIGMGLVLETFGEKFYENGARPGVVLEHPGKLGADSAKLLRDSWEERYGGANNVNKPAVLEEGMKVNTFGMPMEDAQFLQSKKFQGEEIARAFRVQPHIVGIMDHATFTNIEHQGQEFVTYSLGPWLNRIGKRVSLDLLFADERSTYFAEFLTSALLRGDTTARYAAYASGISAGWLTRNEARVAENMNASDAALDEYLQPLNMTTAGSAA
jgi:HK97 family phage portal protein